MDLSWSLASTNRVSAGAARLGPDRAVETLSAGRWRLDLRQDLSRVESHGPGLVRADLSSRIAIERRHRIWIQVAYTKKWLVDLLRRLGKRQAVEDALREMPDEFDLKQLQEFGERHGISRDDVTDHMGGSP